MSPPDADVRAEIARLRHINAILAAYRETSERLLAAATTEQVASIAVSVMTDVFGAEGGALLIAVDPKTAGSSWREYGVVGAAWKKVPEAARQGILEAALRKWRPMVERNAAAFLEREGLPPAPGLDNFLAKPLRLGTQRLGAVVGCNFVAPENMHRYPGDTAALLLPVSHALAYVRLLEASQREARRLSTTLDNTPSGIAYLDRDFRFVQINRAYVAATTRRADQLMGRIFLDVFPGEELKAALEQAREAGEPARFHEFPYAFADQRERGVTYWDWTLSPIKDERGAVESFVISVTEVTDHVRTRERMLEVERARAQLAETLTAEVGHRMKNNLAIVAGLLQLQVAGEPPDSRAAIMAQDAVARVRAIAAVHDQMHRTRIEDVDLLDAVRRVADTAREALSADALDVVVSGKPMSYPSKVATSICIIANELITNAIKHGRSSRNRKLRVRVTLALADGRFRLSVWNSGNPVPRDFDVNRQATMGLRLVRDLSVGHCRGAFTIQPRQGGTIAEVVFDDERLRRMG